jgi:hypothetical protein
MILTVPQDDALYPTLGPQVCHFIEENMVFGPGDLRGQPVVLDDEKRALIYRMYEVYPQGHPQAGRRRFKRCAVSLRKGTGKTELAAWIVACELHSDAPVRCRGFTAGGEPIGGPVTDPYIPMVAYTEQQSDELAYGALKTILENSALRDDFDIGLERIQRLKGDGVAVSLSSNPNARDGARTTMQVFDETHRFTLPRLKLAHQTMLANMGKRKLADPWTLEITTAPEPGVGSIAEGTMEYADQVAQGKVRDAALFFFHRQAGDEHDLATPEGFRAGVIEASGPLAEWCDVDGVMALWNDPTSDRTYLERVWCNRLVRSSTQAFNVELWKKLEKPNTAIASGRLITVGFDGAQFHDSTGIVATDVETGYQWMAGLWEEPVGPKNPDRPWQVPAEDVDRVMRGLFDTYAVWRLYADPPYWQSWIALWRGLWGEERVIEWWTNRRTPTTRALESFDTAIKTATLTHDGDKRYRAHIANSRRHDLPQRDEQGKPLWLIRKDRPDSPHKIDLAMAGVLSWEARTDAIAANALAAHQPEYQMIFVGGQRR